MERRFTVPASAGIRLEKRAEGQLPKIIGYAAVFYDGTPSTEFLMFDDLSERIMPGAFDRAIREDDCRALKNHDVNHLLGRTKSGTLRLSVDARGLLYEIDPPKAQTAQDAIESIERGDLSGSSFAFDIDEQRWYEVGNMTIREIHSVKLCDVGPVVYPAYEGTSTGLRSLAEYPDVASAREAWRKTQGGSLRQKLVGYSARARAVELEHLDD